MPLRRPTAAPLALLAILAACADGAPTSTALLRDGPGERVPLGRFRAEPHPLALHSGVGQPARLVVRDEPLWAATWTAIHGGLTPAPALPAVDFGREMVVVAALGARPSGGYAIRVDSATLHGGTLLVHVRAVSPGPRCGVVGAFSAPVDAVRLPRHDGEIEFRERAEVVRCD